MVATTIVSTSMLSRIAEDHGVHYAETLTGFKWIANAAIDHESTDGTFIIGFEEALGYSIGGLVRDKDGVSAALLFADMVAHWKTSGKNILNRLEELARIHGFHLNSQTSIRLPGAEGAATIATIITRLREDPPTHIGGIKVRRIRDIQLGESRDCATGDIESLDLPASNVLAFDLEDGHRILIRPSGTEPKIKFYYEIRELVALDETLDRVEARAKETLVRLSSAFELMSMP